MMSTQYLATWLLDCRNSVGHITLEIGKLNGPSPLIDFDQCVRWQRLPRRIVSFSQHSEVYANKSHGHDPRHVRPARSVEQN